MALVVSNHPSLLIAIAEVLDVSLDVTDALDGATLTSGTAILRDANGTSVGAPVVTISGNNFVARITAGMVLAVGTYYLYISGLLSDGRTPKAKYVLTCVF